MSPRTALAHDAELIYALGKKMETYPREQQADWYAKALDAAIADRKLYVFVGGHVRAGKRAIPVGVSKPKRISGRASNAREALEMIKRAQ